MRKFLMAAVFAVALSVSACTDTSDTYKVSATDAWSKVMSNGYAASAFAVPTGLLANDVRASFESFPGDRTAYWKFTRKGKELGRINIAVEGDDASSTISYSYAKGDVADEDKKAEQMVRQYSPMLITEAMDAKFDNRQPDPNMKRVADAQSMSAMVGKMMKEANAEMDKAIADMKSGEIRSDGEAAAQSAKYNSTKPTTDLSSY